MNNEKSSIILSKNQIMVKDNCFSVGWNNNFHIHFN